MTMKPYNCSQCGRDAGWNTPARHPQTGDIWCFRCAEEKDAPFLIGVDQHTLEPCGTYYKGGAVLWLRHNGDWNIDAWLDGGTRTFPIYENEKIFLRGELPHHLTDEQRAEMFLGSMILEDNSGIYRCTGCLTKNPKPEAGRPLFAGMVCPSCWQAHLEFLDDQRKRGNVCSFCRQPYGNCCC